MKQQRLKRTLSLSISLLCSTQVFAWTSTSDQEEAMKLTPNLQNGRAIYETCAICHTPFGWGTPDGRYPEIAGQHPNVLIKQLADIRNGNRDNPTMYPFTLPNILATSQDVADIAAYVAQLPMNPANLVGLGNDLAHGKKLYEDNCVECHGANGEGNNEEYYPRLQGQNYRYLLRQMHWIRDGKRRNADKNMVEQIQRFSERDMRAVIDYASRLRPDEKLVAKPDWRNPDFAPNFRTPMGSFQYQNTQ